MRLVGKGWFQENDILFFLSKEIEDAMLVQLDTFYESCNGVRGAILAILGKAAQNKRIVVPKTMIVASEGKHVLFTGLAKETYKSHMIATVLGVDAQSVSHQGIDTQNLMGRRHGECSILIASHYLSRFTGIIMTSELEKELLRDKSYVAYPCGNNIFFVGHGGKFLEVFGSIKTFIKESEIK